MFGVWKNGVLHMIAELGHDLAVGIVVVAVAGLVIMGWMRFRNFLKRRKR